MIEKELVLFSAFSEIDDKLLEDALMESRRRKALSSFLKRRIAATATLVLMVLMGAALTLLLFSDTRQTVAPEEELREESQSVPAVPVFNAGYLTMDVNPSLEFEIRKGTVTQATAFNAEGKALIERLALNGEDLKSAVKKCVYAMADEGYFKIRDAFLPVVLFSARGEAEDTILADAVDAAAVAVSEKMIPAYIVTQKLETEEILEIAAKYGISAGKMQFILYLEPDPSEDFLKDAAGKSIAEMFGLKKSSEPRKAYQKGEYDEFGELVLWAPEYEDSSGWRPWEALSSETQKELIELYSPADLAIMFSEPVWSTMPDVVGLSFWEAADLMHSRNLPVVIIFYDETAIREQGWKEGQVFYQDFPVGMRLDSAAAVQLWALKEGGFDSEKNYYEDPPYIKYWELPREEE